MKQRVGVGSGSRECIQVTIRDASFKLPAQMACSIPRQVGATYKTLWLVSLSIEVADPKPETHTSVVGVDVGVRYLAVTSDTTGRASFHTGKRMVAKDNHYARLRKRLQQKGTRSATRRLVVIAGRERRLKADANHVISKRIVKEHPHSLIGLEDLTDIRERTRRRKGKRASPKQRKAKAARLSRYAELRWSPEGAIRSF